MSEVVVNVINRRRVVTCGKCHNPKLGHICKGLCHSFEICNRPDLHRVKRKYMYSVKKEEPPEVIVDNNIEPVFNDETQVSLFLIICSGLMLRCLASCCSTAHYLS